MSVREPIDAPRYLTMFPLDVQSTVALMIKLLRFVPHSADPADQPVLKQIRPSSEWLRERAVFLQTSWRIREERGSTKLRPIDIEWDSAWGAVLARLEPWAIFAAIKKYALDAQTAQEVIGLLFPNRLDFTRLELNAQWVEGKKRLDWVTQKNLRKPLVELAGAPFVERVEETHQKLGIALGMLGEAPDADLPLVVDLAAAKRSAHDAITGYALQIIAADARASDALSVTIRGALAVIDEFRARASASRDRPEGDATEAETDPSVVVGPEPEVDPSTPIPPLPQP